MFTIPFVFAIYPELLLIDQAVIDPSTGAFLSGYDGQIDVAWMVLLLARVALALYLVSSAMAAFDQKPLGVGQIIIRIILAVFVMAKPLEVYGAAMVAGLGIIVMHSLASRRIAAA
jgi:hypothetical protein